VRPEGQPAFKAKFHEPLMHGFYDHPFEGHVVHVLFDPESHKVKMDPAFSYSPRERNREKKARFDSLADDAPDPTR
jgi:hypothetical protein